METLDYFINNHPVMTSLICVIIIVAATVYALTIYRWCVIAGGKEGAISSLTPTQKFILAASSPTIGNNYKCVIDIWDTHKSEREVMKVKKLFEWGWGEFTLENARHMAEDCLKHGYNSKYIEYCGIDRMPSETAPNYTAIEIELLEEMKQKYPAQGMLAWDLVRVLSIVGGAYMGGIMEYREAAEIALQACQRLQENFSSWDDMVGSYTLGYQFWRGKKQTDRLKYYKKLKRTGSIYKISWKTALRVEEL